MTQSIFQICVLSLQLFLNVPFDKLSGREVSRLGFSGQTRQATRSQDLWVGIQPGKVVAEQTWSQQYQGKVNIGGGDSAVLGVCLGKDIKEEKLTRKKNIAVFNKCVETSFCFMVRHPAHNTGLCMTSEVFIFIISIKIMSKPSD